MARFPVLRPYYFQLTAQIPIEKDYTVQPSSQERVLDTDYPCGLRAGQPLPGGLLSAHRITDMKIKS